MRAFSSAFLLYLFATVPVFPITPVVGASVMRGGHRAEAAAAVQERLEQLNGDCLVDQRLIDACESGLGTKQWFEASVVLTCCLLRATPPSPTYHPPACCLREIGKYGTDMLDACFHDVARTNNVSDFSYWARKHDDAFVVVPLVCHDLSQTMFQHNMSQQVTRLDGRVVKLDTDVGAVRDIATSMKTEVGALSTNVGTLTTEVTSMRAALASWTLKTVVVLGWPVLLQTLVIYKEFWLPAACALWAWIRSWKTPGTERPATERRTSARQKTAPAPVMPTVESFAKREQRNLAPAEVRRDDAWKTVCLFLVVIGAAVAAGVVLGSWLLRKVQGAYYGLVNA